MTTIAIFLAGTLLGSLITMIILALIGINDRDKAYDNMYKVALGHEVYWKEFYEARTKELEAKLRKAEKQNG